MLTPRFPRHAALPLTLAALGCLALPAHAVENGATITPPGIFEFGAGMLPPPTEHGTLGLRTSFVSADDLRDNQGNKTPVSTRLRVKTVSLAYVRTTHIDLLGGKYAFSAIVPWLDMNLRLGIPTPAGVIEQAGSANALGDIQISPVIVQWNLGPGLFANAGLQLQLPTGDYDRSRLINAGSNHWTVTPNAAFTYISKTGFEVSSAFSLNYNARNKDTQYRSGMEFQHDFGVGQHIGPWTVGLGGYRYQQITDDKAPGLTQGNRSRVIALGPAVSFFDPTSKMPIIFAHVYKEFGARNRAQGTQVAIRAAWSF